MVYSIVILRSQHRYGTATYDLRPVLCFCLQDYKHMGSGKISFFANPGSSWDQTIF